MRSLKEYLITEYMALDINKKLMKSDSIITNEITLKDLQDAGFSSSSFDDHSWIVVGNREYHKVKKDGWQYHNPLSSALSSPISSQKLFDLIQANSSEKGYVGEIYLNNPHKIIL